MKGTKTPYYEEEINLRAYLEILLRHWKLALSVPILAILAAAVLNFFVIRPVYEAKSVVALSFAAKVNQTLRIKTLQSLAKIPEIADRVLESIDPGLKPEGLNENSLIGMVDANINGDALEFRVRNEDATRAAAIANAWANVYAEYVTSVYQPEVTKLQSQAEQTRKGYESANKDLIRFIGANRIDALQREIKARNAVLQSYTEALLKIDRLIADAQPLQDRIEQLGVGPEDSLTVLTLRTKALTLTGFSNDVPQLMLSVDVFQAQLVDPTTLILQLDNLITALEEKKKSYADFLAEDSMRQEVLALQVQLEQQQATLRDLTLARDAAWNAYSGLINQIEEIKAGVQPSEVEARVAAQAAVPTRPDSPKKAQNIALAGVAGLMLGIFGAFLAGFLARPKTK